MSVSGAQVSNINDKTTIDSSDTIKIGEIKERGGNNEKGVKNGSKMGRNDGSGYNHQNSHLSHHHNHHNHHMNAANDRSYGMDNGF